METSPKQHQDNPTNTPCSNSSTSSPNSNHQHSNGLLHHQGLPPTTPTSQQPPRPISRSDSANPFPTTFVQADTSSFKQVVQMLTGSSDTAKQAASKPDPNPRTHNIPPVKTLPKKQQTPGFKLYERRNSLKNLRINPLIPVFGSGGATGFSPRNSEILSPSILDFPALVLSPVTPLIPDPFDRVGSNHPNGCSNLNKEAEDKAIKEKGFYLHPSPSTTPRESEPRLLPLFPTTSPRASGSSS